MARNKGNDDLYNLIHSLTPEEKGYFKKFSGRHSTGKSTYVKIFDDIAGQTKFEEASLKKKYKNYAVQKVQLFEAIMDSLLIFQKDINIKAEVLKDIFHILTLTKKGLDNKAEQLCLKALEKAEDAELFYLQIELAQILYILQRYSWKQNERSEKLDKHFKYVNDTIQKQINLNLYHETFQRMLNMEFGNQYQNDGSLDVVKKMVDVDFLSDPSKVLSRGNERFRLIALRQYYLLMNDAPNEYKTVLALYKNEKELWENKSKIRVLDNYIKGIAILVLALIKMGKIKEASKVVEELNMPDINHKSQKEENDLRYAYLKQYTLWHSGKHKAGCDFTNELLKRVDVEKLKERFRLYFLEIYKSKILFEFSTGKFKDIFISIYELNQLELKRGASNYYKGIEVINILINAEIKNYSALHSAIKTALEKKQFTFDPGEVSILTLLKKYGPGNEKEILEKINTKLTEKEFLIFDQPLLKFWVSGRLLKKDISTIVVSQAHS